MKNNTNPNMPSYDETIYYMEEGCGIFACALAKQFNTGKIYIISNLHGEDWNDDIPYELTHVYFSPTRKLLIDARGCRSEAKMAKDFSLGGGDYRIIGGFLPDEFRKRFMGSSDKYPLFGKNKDIKEAEELIKKYPEFYLSSMSVK
jgi:hypothetical protein